MTVTHVANPPQVASGRREFYESANRGPWWDRQVQDIQRGLDWTAGQLPSMPESRRLNGFSLEAIG